MKKSVISFALFLGLVGALNVTQQADAADIDAGTLNVNVDQVENGSNLNWLLENKSGFRNTTIGPGGLSGSGSGIQGTGSGPKTRNKSGGPYNL